MPLLPNILIVDDNSNNLLYLEVILSKIKANLIQASSGAEALEATKDMDLSLAILDVQMPVMNGFELAVRINETRTDYTVPIIFLTAGFPNNAKIEEGYQAGAVDYIVKPLNKTILISKINVFLELYWQKQRLIENESELLLAKQQLEQVNEYQIRAIEDERTAISFQVHDELGQAMTAFKMDLNWIRKNLDNKEQVEQKLDVIINSIKDVIRKVQRISSELHPGILDDLGLVSAIEWYCGEFEERTGITCELSLMEPEHEIPSVSLAFFRILQEAMTNVIRHAEASTLTIQLMDSGDETILKITDNGVGIPENILTSGKSFGMIAMRQRAQQCGGKIEISSTAKNGTTIVVRIPKAITS